MAIEPLINRVKNMSNSVYILYHTRVDELGCDNDKCLGSFSSLEKVEEAKNMLYNRKVSKIILMASPLLSMKLINKNG